MRRRRLIALFGAPAAWLIQMWLSEPLAAHACYPHTKVLDQPLFQHLSMMLIAIGAVALMFGLAALSVAWRNKQTLTGRFEASSSERFLAELGLLASSACVISILFTLAAAVLVSPCRTWS